MSNNQQNGSDPSPFMKWWKSGQIHKAFRITYDVTWNIILFFLIVGVIGVFFAGGIGAGYFASLVKDEPIRAEEEMKDNIYNYEETTELYFSGDKYLGKIRSDIYREEVQLKNVSKHLQNAVIATEDEYFETHKGIVPKAILRAIFQEVTNASTKTGGSTLTQQLIKNQILTNEVSFERKAKEILLAMRLERFFDKEEILEAYLNVVPFGRNASGRNIAGVEAAAQGIFDKSAKDLNVAQSAFIAGLPQSPYAYTPFTNDGKVKNKGGLQPAFERMNTVLNRMHESDMITEAEFKKAKSYDVTKDFAKPEPSSIQEYPFLTFEIEKRAKDILTTELAKQDGYTEKDLSNNSSLKEQYEELADRNLRSSGYKVKTTIDKNIYDKMQQLKDQYTLYGPKKSKQITNADGKVETITEPVEVGGLLMENSTGKIISFIGGRDFERQQLNHATSALRQNGSTMKPLLVYAPGIELGTIQPGSVVADINTSFRAGGEMWSPTNYSLRYHGLTSIRNALAKSYNVPAARTYADIVNQNPTSYLEKMGFTSLTEGDKTNLSMALGGLTNGVTIEENTNAYATFGNMGEFVDAYMIDKIEDADGNVIYEHETKKTKVFSPQTSYLTLDMMRDVIDYGTATYAKSQLKYSGVDWAGKTGTSNDKYDTWFVATNPNVTMGMWMGYDHNIDLTCSSCGLGYSNRNVKLWSQVVNAASDINPDLMVPDKGFNSPGGIVSSSYCASSGLAPTQLCADLGLVKSDIYAAGHAPSKKDNSLISASYVKVGDTSYVAGDSTPKEFTSDNGIYFNPEWLKANGYDKLNDLSQLVPNNSRWADIGVPSDSTPPDDGKAPAAPGGVNVSGGSISWSPSGSSDVVGYRVYKAASPGGSFNKIGSTTGTSLGASGQGVYMVKAVDYFGRESGASSVSKVGDFTPDKPKDNSSDKQNNNNDNNNSNNDSNNNNDNNSDSSNNGNNDNGNNDDGDSNNSGNNNGDNNSGDSGGSNNSDDSNSSGNNNGNGENSGNSENDNSNNSSSNENNTNEGDS
ncbi:transglycosylase domain-containing protein [Pontibacillus salicampi]|uniref:Transglycosylase domain-containing protein n=1 Tax=Pontibacillus salicampi TaxID=1449801 RepID=A0ABV6LIX9_9BACI